MDLYDVNFRNPTLYSIFDIRNLFYLLIYKKYSFAYSSISTYIIIIFRKSKYTKYIRKYFLSYAK